MSDHSRLDSYIIHHTLGNGGTAKVKLAHDNRDSQYYALKIIKAYTQEQLENIRTLVYNEVCTLARVNHPNIVKIHSANENGVYVRKYNRGTYRCLYLVMDYYPMGDLLNTLMITKNFDEQLTRAYFHQLISALQACHSAGVTHRDLKPDNILFGDDYSMKITDFGYSTLIAGRDGSDKLYTPVGTTNYQAPEILEQLPYNGTAIDIFSLGVVLFIIYHGAPPFNEAKMSDPYFRHLITGSERFWQVHGRNRPGGHFSQDFRDLISRMLCNNPALRIGIAQILEHPWYNGPTASNAEIVEKISLRQEFMRRQAEAARQRRLAAGTGSQARHFQGLMSFSATTGSISSFSVSDDPIQVKALPNALKNVTKFNQLITGLNPNEIMQVVSHYMGSVEAEVSTSEKRNFIEAKIVTETDSVTLGLEVWDYGEGLYMLELKRILGNFFEFRAVVEAVGEMVYEVQKE